MPEITIYHCHCYPAELQYEFVQRLSDSFKHVFRYPFWQVNVKYHRWVFWLIEPVARAGIDEGRRAITGESVTCNTSDRCSVQSLQSTADIYSRSVSLDNTFMHSRTPI